MSLVAGLIKVLFPPLHREGLRFLPLFLLSGFILSYIWAPLFWPSLALCVWCYYFFRDPIRIVPQRLNLVIAPADGVVSSIAPAIPPAEMQLSSEPLTRVSIFMNVFNCHVNRSPVAGTVEHVAYHAGAFLNASLDKASELNERNSLRLRLPDGRQVGVVQIAGLIAKRIVCYAQPQQNLTAGERFGIIRFGSRVDVYLPEGVVPLVSVGQIAVGGETILADVAPNAPVAPLEFTPI